MAFLAGITFLNLTPFATAQQRPCTREEEMQAEEDVDHLNDWNAVYKSFKRFSQCDDGAIAEGYSDAVGKLLANNWTQFPDLVKVASNDLLFQKFVLRHVDETIPANTLKRVVQNAKNHCPSDAVRLCKQIAKAASQ